MQISIRSLALCFLASIAVVNASALDNRQAAGGCSLDNVVRALSAQPAEANGLCYSLIFYQPTSTVLVAPPGATPSTTTTTYSLTRSVYPGGRTLEELRFPTGVTSFPASRVSSGCSCFLPATITTTSTVTDPTITRTTRTTIRSTLTGPCATNTPYIGAYSAEPLVNRNQRTLTDFVSLSNAYACCNTCLNNLFCIAYYNVPGVSCSQFTSTQTCDNAYTASRIFVSVGRFPNNIGGKGPCGGLSDVQVVRT